MQPIALRAAASSHPRSVQMPRRHGLFSTTALIPAMAALVGGAMLMTSGQAMAQSLSAGAVATDSSLGHTLCNDTVNALCPAAGASETGASPTIGDLATAALGRPGLIDGGKSAQFFSVTADGYEFNNDFNTQNPLVLSYPVTIVRAIVSSSFHQQSISETGGSRVLRKTGSETLFLLGSDNTYSGGTIVSEGFLGWDRDRAFGIAGTGVTIDNGAGVSWTGSFATTRAFTLTGGIATIRAQSGVTGTVNGTISGPGALTVGGVDLVAPGTIVLGGNNTYQGGTSIVGGTLQISSDSNLGEAGTNVTVNNAVLEGNGTFSINRVIALNNANSRIGVASAGQVMTLSGLVGGIGALNKTGAGTLVLASPNNSYLGGTSVNAGTLRVSSDANLGSTSGGVTLNGGALAPTASFATSRTFTLLSGAGGIAPGSGITLTLNGPVTGVGTLNHIGSGTLILMGTNNYSGGTLINGGTLEVRDGSSLGTGNVLNDGTLLINNANAMTVANIIGSTGALTKTGAGTLTLTNPSNYTGVTTVSQGVLAISNASALGTSAGGTTVASGATLALTSGLTSLAESLNLTGTGAQGVGALRNLAGDKILAGAMGFGGAALITSDSGLLDLRVNMTGANNTVTFGGAGSISLGGGIIGGLTGLTKTGSGTLILGSGFLPSGYNLGLALTQGTLSLRTNIAASFGAITTTGSVIDYATGVTNSAPIVIDSNTTQLQVLSGSATQSGVISELNGPRPLEKIGAGTLVLSGTNTYSGGTTITAGTLSVTRDANLGAASGGVTIGNATLRGYLNSARNFVLTGAAQFDLTDTALLSGTISGSGSLTKLGQGTLILTNDNNSYSGPTTIHAGSVQIGTGGTTGSLGSGNVTNSGIVIINRSNDFTLANAITGTGSLTQSGFGTTTATGALTYNGATSILRGGLVIASGATFGSAGPLTLNGGNFTLNAATGSVRQVNQTSGNLTLGNGAVLDVTTGSYSQGNGNILGSGTIRILSGGFFTVTGAGTSISPDITVTSANSAMSFVVSTLGADYTLAPTLTGANLGLRMQNDGYSVTVTGNNSHGRGTWLEAGGLIAATDTALGTGTLSLAPNTTFLSGGTGNRTIANNITLLNGGGIVIGNPNAGTNFTLNGAISGTGFTKTGAGTLILTGTNSYSGGTTISSGILQVGSGSLAGSLGSGGVAINAGTTLVFDSSASQNVANVLSGAGSLIKRGSGTLTLSGTNSFTGAVSLNGGSLQLNGGSSIGDMAAVSLATGTNLGVSSNETIGSLSGAGTVVLQSDAVLTIGGDNNSTVFAGSLTGIGGVTKTGSGTFIYTGTGNFQGTLTISGGTLQLGDSTTTGAINGGPIVNNASLVFNRSNDNSVNALISGTGTVTKQGTNTLTVTGANSYSGGTTISGGTLQLGSGSTVGSLGTGGVTISSGTTLLSNSSGAQSLGALSGSGSLVQSGTGVLTLTAAASGFSGSTTINAGTIAISTGNALGTGGIDVRGGGLQTNATMTLFNTLRFIDSNNSRLTAAAGTTLTLTGQVLIGSTMRINGGAGSIVRVSAGTAGATPGFSRIIVEGGTLQAGTNSSLSFLVDQSALTQIDSGATLDLNGRNTPIDNLQGAGTLLNGAATTTIGGGSFSGVIGGSQSIISTGDLTLSGASTYSGTTSVQSGTLAVRSVGALGNATGGTSVASGATVSFAGGLSIAEALSVSGTGVGNGGVLRNISDNTFLTGLVTATGDTRFASDAGYLVFNGGVNGGGFGLTIGGTGSTAIRSATTNVGSLTFTPASGGSILELQGTNLTAPLTVNGGFVQLYANALIGTASVAIGSSGTVQVITDQNIANLSGTGRLILNGGSLTLGNANGSGSFAGVIQNNGVGGFTKVGTGTFTLTGANTYTGTTTISDGTLQIGNGGTTGTLGTGAVVNNATLSVNRANGTTLTNAISGTGALVLNGAGPVSLSGANSYSGGTAVNAGTLLLSHATNAAIDAAGTGQITLGSGTALLALGTGTLANSINIAASTTATIGAFTSTTLSLTGNFQISSPANLTFGSSTETGVVALAFAPGTTVISGVRATVAGGTVRIDNGSGSSAFSFASAGTTIGTGGTTATLDVNGINLTLVNLSGNGAGVLTNRGTQAATVAFNNQANSTYAGAITNGSAALNLIKTGGSTLTLTGAGSYTGTTTISSGALQVGNGGTSGTLGSGVVAINAIGRLILNRSNALTMANVFTGAGAIDQAGTGTVTLTGNNNAGSVFTGTLNVTSGNLVVNGVFGDVTGRAATVNIDAGTSLGGSGTIHGNVVVANGGAMGPGNSPGTQTIAGNLTLNAGSILNFELAQAGVVGGGVNDLINVGGNLTLDGTLNVTALSGFGAGYYRLFNYGGTLTNNVLSLGTVPGGYTTSILTDIAGQVNILFNDGAALVQYWDGSDLSGATATVNGDGGSGTWSASRTSWTNPTGFGLNSGWAGQTGVFAGANGGTVTIAGTQAFQQLQFRNNYTLTAAAGGGALATTGGTSIIDVANGMGVMITAPIQGSAGLTKSGGGTLTLTGDNSYTGTTSVNAGTLTLFAGGRLAGAVENSATFNNSGTVVGLVTNSGTLTSTNGLQGGLTNNSGASATLRNLVQGAVSNAGTITLSGTATFTGGVSQTATGTFDLAGFNTNLPSLSGAGTVQLGSATLTLGGDDSSFAFAGVISGTGSLSKIGTGTLTLSGANGFTGTTSNSGGGTLAITAPGSLAGTVSNSATLNNAGTIAGLVTNMGQLTSTGTLNGGLANTGSGSAQLSGQVNGTVTNAGSITLTGATSGITTLIQNSGSFDLGGFDTGVGTLSGTGGTIALGSATLTFGGGNQASVFDGSITGTGGIVKTGTQETTLGGALGFTGTTSILGGGLTLRSGAMLTGAVDNAARFTNNGTVLGLVTNAGTLTSTGTLNGGLVNQSGATANLMGTLNGAVANSGTITLIDTLNGIGALSQTATGSIDLAGFTTMIGSLSGSGTVQLGSATLMLGGNNGSTAFDGTISGNGGLNKVGTGTFILSGANDYAGLTRISQGVLAVTGTGTLGSTADGTLVDSGAALALDNGVTVTGEALTLNGTGIADGGALFSNSGNNHWAGTVTLASNSSIVALADRLDIDLLDGSWQNVTLGGAGLIALGNATTAGRLTLNGTGSAALLGGGDFAAGVDINAATLFVQGGTSINDLAAVTLGSGTLVIGASETIGSLAATGGTVQIDAGQTLTLGGNDASTSFAGTMVSGGNLVKQGGGTFTVTGLLAHGGTTAILGGTLLSGAADIWSGNGTVSIGASGTLDLGGFAQTIAAVTLDGGTLANGSLNGLIRSNGGTIRAIGGANNALIADAGVTVLTGTGSFAQGVQLAGGDVTLAGAGESIADTALVSVDSGTLTVNVAETIGALTGTGGTVQIAGGESLTSGGNNASTSYAGTLTGAGSLVKTGTGTLILSGVNTLTGTVRVSGGVLTLNTGGSLAGPVLNDAGFSNAGLVGGLVTNNGTLVSTGTLDGGLTNTGTAGIAGQLNGAVDNSGLIQLQGAVTGINAFTQTDAGQFDLAGFDTSIGTLSGTGGVLLGSATLTLGANDGSSSFAGTIGGTGGLVKTGTGTFTLTTGQGYTGLTTVSGGTLAIGANGGLTGSVLNNARFTSAGLILGSLTNNGTASLAGQVNGAVTNNGGVTLVGNLAVVDRFASASDASLDLSGFVASLGSLSGAGSIQLGSGTLLVGADGTSTLFSGAIGGTGGLQKLGDGILTLTGANSYTGTTIISAGTLVIGQTGNGGGANSGTAPAALTIGTIAASAPAAQPATTAFTADSSAAAAIPVSARSDGRGSAPVTAIAGQRIAAVAPEPQQLSVSIAAIGGAEALPEITGVIGSPERVAQAPTRAALLNARGNGAATVTVDGGGSPVALASAPVAGPDSAVAPVAFASAVPNAGSTGPAVIAGDVANYATLINYGSILGQLYNASGATATNTGTIAGLVSNVGTFTSTGTLSGGLANTGTARISGVLTGAVTNVGSITLTGVTSGITSFQQDSTGSLNLAGFDTALGILSGAGTIALGNARLTTGADGVASLFSGVISGTGSLTKTGTGGLILDGDNLYSGGTVIAAGTLQIGNGGTTGSIIGPVLNNGTLIVNRSNGYTISSPISGTGMLVQAGSGTTTLTGAHSYSGGTLISGGRLIGSTTSLQGLIQNDAALEFAQGAVSGIFSGRIGGTGTLEKAGSGLLDLIGDNSGLTGATLVRTGELRVTGSLGRSVTTLMSGARLTGNGVVGGLVAQNGSVVSPGVDGVGVLSVNGSILFQPGSTLQVQIQAASGADRLLSNGTAQLAGALTIANLGGTYAFNSEYLLVEATGGRTGNFDTVSGLTGFGMMYRPTLVYTGTQVRLRMAPNLLTDIVGSAPLSGNQRSVASRIDAAVLGGYNPQPLSAVYNLSSAQLPGAFDQLSGEVYATAAGVGIDQQRLVGDTLIGRLADVATAARGDAQQGTGKGAWGQLLGSWGTGSGDGNAARYSSDRTGFMAGIDIGSADGEGSWRAGLIGLYMKTRVSVDARGSRAEVEQAGGGVYAGFNSGAFGVAAGVTAAAVNLNATRDIALPGFAEAERGKTKGSAIQGFARVSYDAIDAGNATVRPFAGATLGSFRLNGLTETGGAAALAVQGQRYTAATASFGTDATLPIGKINLSATVAGRLQLGDRSPAAVIALAAAPGQAASVAGVQLDRLALTTRLDATTAIARHVDVSLGYTGLIGKDSADHGARASLTIRF